VVCERDYEAPDMAHCPAYQGAICSLCCTLDARCGDLCKPPEARLAVQWGAALRRLLPRALWPQLDTGLGHYLMLMLIVLPVLAAMTALLERHGFAIAFAVMLLVAGVVCWWLVLAHKSRRGAAAGPPRRRAGQPGQEPLHQRHQPRVAHAAELHPRLRPADGGGPGHPAAPPPGRQRDPARGRAPALAD